MTQKIEKSHKTKKIAIKTAEVDEKIIPIIEWLNSFKSVRTLFCCQGDVKNRKGSNLPYILFVCEDKEDLANILKIITLFAGYKLPTSGTKVECDYYDLYEPIRYSINFYNQKAMLQFIDYLKKEKIWPK